MKKILLGLVLLIAFSTSYNNISYIEELGSYEIRFCPRQNCSELFIFHIDNNYEVECAFYSLNHKKLENLLELKAKTLILHNNSRRGLMHHKFCVLNSTHVITGSVNPTMNDFYNNHNNVLLIESEVLVSNYKNELKRLQGKEFEFLEEFKRNGKLFSNYFCPSPKCQRAILDELMKAEEEILFLTFTFTDQKIASVLNKKHKEGLVIKGVLDNFQNKQYWVYPMLEFDVLINRNNLQHNKLFLVDGKVLITGSYNPTRAAFEINSENILIIREKEVVSTYRNYFFEVYNSI